MSSDFRAQNDQWLGGLLVALVLFGILAFILLTVAWPTSQAAVPKDAISELGQALVDPNQYVLVFEVASVLLLVALVGAVIIAREK